MPTLNLNSGNDGQTFNLSSNVLAQETVNVTTSTAVPPTVNINASLATGVFTINATAGATVNLDEVVGAAGTFKLDANGGNIVANGAVGLVAGTSVTIEGGGTFTAGSSFLGLLNNTLVNFAAGNTATDTYVIDNNGGLLNLSFTSPIGGFNSANDVINDKLISGAAVAKYNISQTIVGGPQTLTFQNSAGQSLGSLTFTANTFSAAQLGLHAKGTGPLSLATAADGSLSTAAACYLPRTHILTSKGEVAVEELQIGDEVVTASGATRPVTWLGHRRIDLTRHPEPESVRPIRVAANAFGDLPRRDLWLSPEHCVAFEGALIPIRFLVNGISVAQIDRQSVEYWHVELDSHDVILAEGLPAESYLDTGNRCAFVNGGAFVEAHPDFKPRHWADTCIPMVFEGPVVAAAKAQLLAHLAEMGCGVTQEADPHVCVDGRRVDPIRSSDTQLTFALPPGGREIWLRSREFVPAHTVAHRFDRRTLGLNVSSLQIDGLQVDLTDNEVCASGWHAAEFADAAFSHRWTTGATSIAPGARIVVVQLASLGFYWPETQHDAVAMVA